MHFLNLGIGFLCGMLGWRNLEIPVVLMEFVPRIGRAPYKNQQLVGALAVQRIKGNLGKLR